MERIGKIMKKMTKKKIHEIDKYKYDVHELTDCLKRYLRDYPEKLITKDVVEQVEKLCGKYDKLFFFTIMSKIQSDLCRFSVLVTGIHTIVNH